MSSAVICAVTELLLTNVVARALPFHCTVAPFTKPVPLAVDVNAGQSGATLLGVIVVIASTGFGGGGCIDPPPHPATRNKIDTRSAARSVLLISLPRQRPSLCNSQVMLLQLLFRGLVSVHSRYCLHGR
jgi:hypothetical protein